MNKEIKAKWIDALGSGEYEQAPEAEAGILTADVTLWAGIAEVAEVIEKEF